MLSALPSKEAESSHGREREGFSPLFKEENSSFSRKLFSFQGRVADISL